MHLLHDKICESANFIHAHWNVQPRMGIILGSGLGLVGDAIEVEDAIDYGDVPHFLRSTAVGHRGRLLCGRLAGVPVVAMQGRFHCYEGYSAQRATFPVRVMKALGVGLLVVSNAAGGLNPTYAAGDVMVIDDHINLLNRNPLIGVNDDRLGPRFPDMSAPYDHRLGDRALAVARRHDFVCHRGVYIAMLGPTYETRAEIRMLRYLGGDAVGMSTVPEAIVAAHAGMRVLGLSTITNECSPDVPHTTSGEEVVATAETARDKLRAMVTGIVASEFGNAQISAAPLASHRCMNVVNLISKKRDGGELSTAEIAALITGYVRGDVPDYQMSAWAMTVFLRGMTVAETAALTEHMLHSGVTFQWPAGEAPKVDKHSTGGIGDKVSLPLAPLLACCGVQVPMISGRGLGATGGTLDKLEAIPGFRTNLSTQEMQAVCRRVGCVISGATADLVPADRKLYALRDVTGTVPSIPLITASIMSKKLAEGLDALVLDVKHGSGAFMKTLDQARELASSMVNTGWRMGVPTSALVTDMNQPLGRMAGNAVEVNESIDLLRGRGPADLIEATLELGAELLVLAKRETTLHAARSRLRSAINSGAGLEKFREMVAAQGGDLDALRPVAPTHELLSIQAGYVAAIDTERLGHVIIELGGGRKKLGDVLNHSVGLEMLVRLGDEVEVGEPLLRIFAQPEAAAKVRPELLSAITITDNRVDPRPLIVERIVGS